MRLCRFTVLNTQPTAHSLWSQKKVSHAVGAAQAQSRAHVPQLSQETTRLKMYRFSKLILCKQVITA